MGGGCGFSVTARLFWTLILLSWFRLEELHLIDANPDAALSSLRRQQDHILLRQQQVLEIAELQCSRYVKRRACCSLSGFASCISACRNPSHELKSLEAAPALPRFMISFLRGGGSSLPSNASFHCALFPSEQGREFAAKGLQLSDIPTSDACRLAMRKGGEAFQQGDFDSAVRAYTEAIEHDPNNARAFSSRAIAFMRADKVAEALADAQRAKALAAPGVMLRSNSFNATSVSSFHAGEVPNRVWAEVPAQLWGSYDAVKRSEATSVPPPRPSESPTTERPPEMCIRFTVRYRATDSDEVVRLTGNHHSIGGWSPSSGLELRPTVPGLPHWTATLKLPATLTMPLHYR